MLDLSKNINIEAEEFKAKNLLNFVKVKDIGTYKQLIDSVYTTLQDSLT